MSGADVKVAERFPLRFAGFAWSCGIRGPLVIRVAPPAGSLRRMGPHQISGWDVGMMYHEVRPLAGRSLSVTLLTEQQR